MKKLSSIALIAFVLIVVVVVTIAIDYSNHLRNLSSISEMTSSIKERYNPEMIEICKAYRAYQGSIDGHDTTTMDEICSEIEKRTK